MIQLIDAAASSHPVNDYLQIICNSLLVPATRMDDVRVGLRETGCSAQITDVRGVAIARYSDGPEGPAPRSSFCQHLVTFDSGADAEKFQSWLDENEEARRIGEGRITTSLSGVSHCRGGVSGPAAAYRG